MYLICSGQMFLFVQDLFLHSLSWTTWFFQIQSYVGLKPTNPMSQLEVKFGPKDADFPKRLRNGDL